MCPRLQPHVSQDGTVCIPGCSRMCPRLEPYVSRAATVCVSGCNRVYAGLQPHALRLVLVAYLDDEGSFQELRELAREEQPLVPAGPQAAGHHLVRRGLVGEQGGVQALWATLKKQEGTVGSW